MKTKKAFDEEKRPHWMRGPIRVKLVPRHSPFDRSRTPRFWGVTIDRDWDDLLDQYGWTDRSGDRDIFRQKAGAAKLAKDIFRRLSTFAARKGFEVKLAEHVERALKNSSQELQAA